jgi:hypothetical protein
MKSKATTMRSSEPASGGRAVWASNMRVFNGPGAALAPASGAHFLDQAELDLVDGPEVYDVPA